MRICALRPTYVTLLSTTLLIAASQLFAYGLKLSDGRPVHDIVIASDAPDSVKFAAKDLARCLTQVSGRTYQAKESAGAAQTGDIILVNDPKLEKQQWQFAFRDGKLYRAWEGWSATTGRHFTAFARMMGFGWLTKKDWDRLEVTSL